MTEVGRERLANGLEIVFTDASNRYFGDYHRLRIEVTLQLTLPEDDPDGDGFWLAARRLLGTRFRQVRTLERMGVPSAEVTATRQQLIDSYLQSTAAYLARPEALRALIAGELDRRGRAGGPRYG
ncbi:MAG: hypothetical protein RQ723_06620 [Desulfuromonadales bacterium]|nr:hypothetical protein [Desulfuromonadales bacterium]